MIFSQMFRNIASPNFLFAFAAVSAPERKASMMSLFMLLADKLMGIGNHRNYAAPR